jgi:predicted RNA-binding protein with PUA-like domain
MGRALKRMISLPELREMKGLESMVLLRKGSRLSVQPVSAKEWKIILAAGGL